MDLSIIVVNWNSKDYLAQALACIPIATDFSFEIIVIDSGSFDGSAELVRESFPQVRFIQSKVNLGFARANNAAFTASSGKVLLFLNPDTEVVGDAIGEMYRVLTRLPRAAIVGPRLLNSDGSLQQTCVRAFPTILNQCLDADVLHALFPNAALWGQRTLALAGSDPRQVDAVSGASLMIRRAVFEQVGLFSTDYFMYAEDMDLCLKAKRSGFETYFVPTATVVHHGGGSSGRTPTTTFSAVMALESQWRFFRKSRSLGYAVLYRGAMFVSSILRLVLLLLLWPIRGLRDRNWYGHYALRKWGARLRWTLGAERWVRNY
jgi:N-acetylglucosaminyl-diphospho-decaprenol L-rhamnosyltransferase